MALESFTLRLRPAVIQRIKDDAVTLDKDPSIHGRNLVDAALTRDDGRELHLLRLAVQNQTAHIEALTAQQNAFYTCVIESVEDMLINQALPVAERLRIPFVRKKIKALCLRLGLPYTQPLED